MKIAIGCDHNGLVLKRALMDLLQEEGHSFYDFGCYDSSSVDYPDIATEVAEAVAKKGFERGFLVCGTGIGMSITSNKVKGIRAALCHDAYTARMAREHNDANVLCLGGNVLAPPFARDIARSFLSTQFNGAKEERHARRVNKIRALEQS
ncbi:MAG: ribose 5-phosphate isomerase B [Chloroflexi bacterium]|nr:ribose 5-phosphate isomerase B [Chloroflexota bacterium]